MEFKCSYSYPTKFYFTQHRTKCQNIVRNFKLNFIKDLDRLLHEQPFNTSVCWHLNNPRWLPRCRHNASCSGAPPLTGTRSCLPPARAGKQGWRGTVTARTNWPAATVRPTSIDSGCKARQTFTAVHHPSQTYQCYSQVKICISF